MRGRVPRLDEAAHNVPHARAVDDRQRALGGVADERDVADPLDRRGSGECGDRADDAERRRSTTASRDSASHVTSTTGPGARPRAAERTAPRQQQRGTRGGSRLEYGLNGAARSRYGGRMSHPELADEQAYVDRAYEHLERMRAAVAGAADHVEGEVAQAAMDAWAARRLRTFEDAERGLCFGRLDFETIERPLYVGRRFVHDETQRQLVVNWQAPAARPFYTATPQTRTGSRCAAGSAPRAGGSSTSPTRRSTARSSTAPRSTTSCSRSSSAAATRTCATSSRRSRPTSTA